MSISTTNPLDGLLAIRDGNPSARWNFPLAIGSARDAPAGIGSGVSLTYHFPTSQPGYFSTSGLSGFQPATTTEQQATRQVLTSYSSWLNIQFQEQQSSGQLSFANSSQGSGTGGFAYYPSYSYLFTGNTITAVTENEKSGDVWLNASAHEADSDWLPGGDGYATLLHEIGHALGLKHPFEGAVTLASSLDNERYTVMSYADASNTNIVHVSGTSSSYSYTWEPLRPSTLMPLDFVALKHLYGANPNSQAGNTTYQWDRDAEILETINDASGIDTIDASNQRLSCRLDLRAGTYSSIGIRSTDAQKRSALGLPGWFKDLPEGTYNGKENLAIAAGVTIENAFGGTSRDVLIGNNHNNLLCGGPGRDVMTGGGGNDSDSFLFNASPSTANSDTLKDFHPATDRILLDDDIFTRFLGSPSGIALNAEALHIGSAPTSSTDHLIYDTTTDLLSYAPDGNASSTLLPIATILLPGDQALTASALFIID